MAYITKSKIKILLKTIFSKIKKADQFCVKYKLYQWICIAIFSAIILLLLNSYNISETHANYTVKSKNTIRLNQGTPVSLKFEAKSGNLDSFLLFKDAAHSRNSASDEAKITIVSPEGEQILSTQVYLYHPSRSYIMVDCGNLALKKGEVYTITFQISSLSDGSIFYLESHESNFFGSITSDTFIGDMPGGLSLVPNVTYNYSVLSYSHMIPHQILFFMMLIGLFFTEFMKKRWVKEVYRGAFVCILIYLTQEILNIAKSDPMQMLFPFTVHNYFLLLTGLLIIVLFYYLFYAITGNGTIAIVITSGLGILVGYVNHMKIMMRGDPATPWDLFSAGMAAKISLKYKFHITQRFIASILMVILIIIVIRLIHTPFVRGLKKRLTAILITALLFTGLVFGVVLNQPLLKKMDVSYSLFPPLQSFKENGTMLALALQFNHLSVNGGENNSKDATEDLIKQYAGQVKEENLDSSAVTGSNVKPNVICIMSESFSEMNEIRTIETTEPVTPFYDSLKKESMYGDLAVSIFGGGTCNTEFEFLTGFSVRSLVPGSSIYDFYVNHPLDALPQIFKDQGYITQAIHPFDAAWWGRADAYPLLGFDQFISDADFINPKIVREYISDKSAIERVITEYQNKPSNTPLFSFLVTMQNHADYTEYWDNQAYNIKITNFPGNEFPCTEHYFSLIRESDDALKELITYFRTLDEPTIIVFFGDHKPYLDTELYSTLLGVDWSSLTASDALPIYTTPYLIWANYGIEKGDAGLSSPNFLGQTVLDLAGIKSPDERACLRMLQTKISAISALAVFDKSGAVYTSEDLVPADIAKYIDDYQFIQYGKLFLEDTVTADDKKTSAG